MRTNGHVATQHPFDTLTRLGALRTSSNTTNAKLNGNGNNHANGQTNGTSTPNATTVVIDGHSLSVADVVAVANHNVPATLSESCREKVEASVRFLESKLKGHSVYGVTTGFGGSADTRTADTMALQVSLLEHQLCGVLPGGTSYEQMLIKAMPIPIVKGAMLVRVNSLSRGHSGVRWKVLEAILAFLNRGLVPCVPLRGSISASGDLSPLSYIAASICGHPDVRVFDTTTSPPSVHYANEIIEKYGLEKITLAPKEGLGILNGTAFSCSAGALALHEAECLATLTQVTTALTVEAMTGQVGSFDEFIHDVTRPHDGQVQAARNIRNLLEGSKLAIHEEGEVAIQDDVGILRQDRYALRTSAQWIGPQLESLELARRQVEVELNSTTDNPLIDVEGDRFHHGGNFQAMSITQAMESTRLCIQHFGKLAFAQVAELCDCSKSNGLPSCLAGDEPSTNYHLKGCEIHSAAYMAELGYLCNPVSSHVQSAEMGNQSVNSLALISARKTLESCDVLTLLLSTQLYSCAQAIDLRIMDVQFQAECRAMLEELTEKYFGAVPGLHKALATSFLKRLIETPSFDSAPRFEDAATHLVGTLVNVLAANGKAVDFSAVVAWKGEFAKASYELYNTIRTRTMKGQDNLTAARDNLGRTLPVYELVRRELGVAVRRGDVAEGRHGLTIGSAVSKIAAGIKDGRVIEVIAQILA